MLCAKCSEIFKGSKRLARCLQPNYDFNPFIPGEHHDTLEQFQAAIKEGCHFCSLIIGSLDLQGSTDPWKWTHYNLGYPDGRALTLKFSYKLPEPGYSPTVDFRLCPVDEEDLMASLNLGEVESNTGSKSSWKHAVSWIENCKTNHKTCLASYKDEGWKPTRLLKVSENPDSLRLCEKDEIPDGTIYTTLSHCWGAVVLGTLLTTNIESLKKSIPLGTLVKTFQDAVEVTRRLGVEYIWIDCLCIIQDSREDWKHESMRMEAVYGHSYCNIAATASADGRGGLFRERDPKMIEPCTINMSTSVKGRKIDYRVSDFAIWWKHFESSPLNVRAWVMQERLLSPRVLQFDRDQLLWECNELTACERHPGGMENLIPKDSTVRRFRLPPREVVGTQAVLDLWSPILKIYSATRITKDTDRLVALYGVAVKVQRLFKCEYHAGLWSRDIESQLAWKASDPIHSHRPSEYVAPSWSWASVVGEINLMPQWDELDRASFQEEHLCKVLSIDNPGGRDSDSVIISYEVLQMRCYLVPVTIVPIEQLYWDRVLPPYVDDDGKILERNDQIYEDESQLDGNDADENESEEVQDDEGGEEDDGEDDGEDMEERETPWVALYRTRDGQGMDLNLWREVDTEDEWAWETPRRRWLMPTCLAQGLMRGVILEKREADGGKFRRCGAFGYRSWEQSYEQGQDMLWSCIQDVKSAAGLEKQPFDGVLSPVFKDSAQDGESLLNYELQDNISQYVISII